MQHAVYGVRVSVILVLLTSLAGAADGTFRNAQGDLQLVNCAKAREWLPQAGERVSRDVGVLLDRALDCAKDGDAASVTSLLALADGVPPLDLADEIGNGVKRVRVLLAVDDVERAQALLLATGARTVAALREQPDNATIATQAFWQTSLNNQAAMRLRSTQPRNAIEHQLLGADLHELAGELGNKEIAVLYHQVALDIAAESDLVDESLRTAQLLLALHARYPDLEGSLSASSIAGAALSAATAGRRAEANALLNGLAETGWPQAAGLVESVRMQIEPRVPGGRP